MNRDAFTCVLSIAVVTIAVFWDVIPYCLVEGTNILEEPAASILRAEEREPSGEKWHMIQRREKWDWGFE
jgi:hypothetical protein